MLFFSTRHQTALCRVFLGLGLMVGAAQAADSAAPSVPQVTGNGGIPRFLIVNPRLYRGGQPDAAGFRFLSKLGVKTVIDLREYTPRSEEERKAVEVTGMKYVNIPMRGMETPAAEKVDQAIRLLQSNETGPVFVHCRLGKDRTGLVVACYRVTHDGWDNRKALAEARHIGMSWFQFPLQRFVMAYKTAPVTPGEKTINAEAAVLPALQ